MQGSDEVVILGAGGHAASVLDAAVASGLRVRCLVDEFNGPRTVFGLPVERRIPDEVVAGSMGLIIAIGDNFHRDSARLRIRDLGRDVRLPPVLHPHAHIAATATIGPGSIVLAGAVVGPGATLGELSIINTGAIVEHECAVADCASLAPRSVLGGRARVGRRSAICLGAVIRQGLSVGEDTVVGAASYLHHDLPAGVVAYGTPARVVRRRDPSDPYL